MTISSTAFSSQGLIPPAFSCEGPNYNPPLKLTDIPTQAVSLALSVEDPDSPGRIWQHWLVWNIAPDTAEISSGQLPPGAQQGMTDFGRRGYAGPCPATGEHHYIFRLYALDAKLILDDSADRAIFDQAIAGHVLNQTELVGTFAHTQG